jgi:hypothetical protein
MCRAAIVIVHAFCRSLAEAHQRIELPRELRNCSTGAGKHNPPRAKTLIGPGPRVSPFTAWRRIVLLRVRINLPHGRNPHASVLTSKSIHDRIARTGP